MTYKWIGAMLVILSCGGCGFSLVAQQKRQERLLEQLIRVLNYMSCELPYHLTPLPDLCRQAGREVTGPLRQILTDLSVQLDNRAAPEVSGCMKGVLKQYRDIPGSIRRLLWQLGRSLGRFDLPGQLQGLKALQGECRRERQRLAENRTEKRRSCETLGICAGAALVILFA